MVVVIVTAPLEMSEKVGVVLYEMLYSHSAIFGRVFGNDYITVHGIRLFKVTV
jgi:hypothetical protein